MKTFKRMEIYFLLWITNWNFHTAHKRPLLKSHRISALFCFSNILCFRLKLNSEFHQQNWQEASLNVECKISHLGKKHVLSSNNIIECWYCSGLSDENKTRSGAGNTVSKQSRTLLLELTTLGIGSEAENCCNETDQTLFSGDQL